MYYKELMNIIKLLLSFLLIVACSKKPETPSEIADQYVKALYIDYDFEKANELSNDDMRKYFEMTVKEFGKEKILEEYKKDSIGLKYKIVGEKIREGEEIINGQRVGSKATVNVQVEQNQNGNPVRTVIGIRLVQQEGRWLVSNRGRPFEE